MQSSSVLATLLRSSAAVATLMTCFVAVAESAKGGQPTADAVTVPFRISQHDGYGSRPVVKSTINGQPFRLVVHSSSGFYLQINHAEAKAVGARDLKHAGAYGITSAGHVSALGQDNGYIQHLKVGEWSVPEAPVAVFEVPAQGSPGMLGLPFLSTNNVIVDFEKQDIVIVGAKPSGSLAEEMKRRGYGPHKLSRDSKTHPYMVNVSINGIAAPMIVSTVATVILDEAFATKAKVPMGNDEEIYGGPSGTTGKSNVSAKPVKIKVDSWISPGIQVHIEDVYGYTQMTRPTEGVTLGGNLGADFMIANKAVIDFGNGILYLKNN